MGSGALTVVANDRDVSSGIWFVQIVYRALPPSEYCRRSTPPPSSRKSTVATVGVAVGLASSTNVSKNPALPSARYQVVDGAASALAPAAPSPPFRRQRMVRSLMTVPGAEMTAANDAPFNSATSSPEMVMRRPAPTE